MKLLFSVAVIAFSIVSITDAVTVLCYQCSSAVDGQADCADGHKIARKYVQPCFPKREGPSAGKPAIGCRKVVQGLDGPVVIRECAYEGEIAGGEHRSSAGHDGPTNFYDCTIDSSGEPCNGIARPAADFLFTIIALFLAFTYAR